MGGYNKRALEVDPFSHDETSKTSSQKTQTQVNSMENTPQVRPNCARISVRIPEEHFNFIHSQDMKTSDVIRLAVDCLMEKVKSEGANHEKA